MFNRPRTKWIVLLITGLAVGFFSSLDEFILLKDSVHFWGEHLVISMDTHIHVLWPQVREVIDGYPWVADTQLFEHRFGPPMTPWPWFPIFLYTIFWKIFGAAQLLPWSKLIVATLSFILLAELITEMTGRRKIGLLAAFLLFTSRLSPIFFFPASSDELKLLINLFVPGSFDTIVTTRMDFLPYESFNPGFLVLGSLMLLAYRTIKQDRMKLLIPTGLLAGLLIYAYPFFWIFGVMFLGGWGLVELIRRRFVWFGHLVVATLANFLISAPFWWNQVMLKKDGLLAEMNLRNAGFELGHYFRFSQWRWYLVWGILIAINYWFARRKKDTSSVYFLSLLFLGVFFSLNMQVITGTNIHTDHWINKLSFLPLGFALFMLFNYCTDWLAEKKLLRKSFGVALLSVLILGTMIGGMSNRIETAARREINFPFSRDQWETYKWIDKNVAKDDVVLTLNNIASTYLTIYTGARSFLPHALNTHAFDQEIFDRLYASYAFYGVPVNVLKQQFKDEEEGRGVLAQFFWVKYRPNDFDGSIVGYKGGGIPKETSDSIINSYKNYKLDLREVLSRYRLNYILETPYERQTEKINLSKLPYLEKVFEHGKVKLYKLRPELIR